MIFGRQTRGKKRLRTGMLGKFCLRYSTMCGLIEVHKTTHDLSMFPTATHTWTTGNRHHIWLVCRMKLWKVAAMFCNNTSGTLPGIRLGAILDWFLQCSFEFFGRSNKQSFTVNGQANNSQNAASTVSESTKKMQYWQLMSTDSLWCLQQLSTLIKTVRKLSSESRLVNLHPANSCNLSCTQWMNHGRFGKRISLFSQ